MPQKARYLTRRIAAAWAAGVAVLAAGLVDASCGGSKPAPGGARVFRSLVDDLTRAESRTEARAAIQSAQAAGDDAARAVLRRRAEIYEKGVCAGANYIAGHFRSEGVMPSGSPEWQAWWYDFARRELAPMYDEASAGYVDWVAARLADWLYSRSHPDEALNVCHVLRQF